MTYRNSFYINSALEFRKQSLDFIIVKKMTNFNKKLRNSSSNTWNFIGILPDLRKAIDCKSIASFTCRNNKEICTNSRIQRSLQSSQQLSQLGAQKLEFLAVFPNKTRFCRTFRAENHTAAMKLLTRPILKEIGPK